MAKKVKYPLKMADGAQARNLEELREHFDIVAVLGYYDSGKLSEWLEDRYYDAEAEKIRALDPTAGDFKKRLCDVLGAAYSESEADNVDLTDISARNERRARLKAFTADDKILAAVGSVAFSQEELDVLLADGANPIYLCGKQFNVSESKGGITYIGIDSPTVTPPVAFVSQGIILKSVEIEPACIVQCANATEDLEERAKLWRMAADKGEMQAQYQLGKCYEDGAGVKMDAGEAARWYRKAAEQGYAEAQNSLGYLS
jgi:hypothetical protein